MRTTVRAPLVAIVLLTATPVRGQSPPVAGNPRAQDVLSRTKAGQEDQVACAELGAGVGHAAAIELLRTPRYAHPDYWAGFMLVGDSD